MTSNSGLSQEPGRPQRRSESRRVRVLLLVGVSLMGPVAGAAAAKGGVTEGGVAVFPGDSIQALVNANPEGTTFLIKAGVHRRQHVVPKNRDSFIGEPGAVLTGEDITEYAFTGTAVHVTIRSLIVEHYNSPSADYPIQCSSAGYWVIEDNEIRYNAHIGLGAGPRWVVRNNFIHHNGQMGMFAVGEDIVVEGNEIAFNNTDHHSSYWEAGGTKFVYTTNLVVRNNYVHDNEGPGLWTDINNIYTLYEGNRVIDNYGPGINHEVSYDAVIRNNTVEGNGFGWTGWVDGAGILVANSPNVEVYGNTVRYNNDGIAGEQVARPDSATAKYGPWELKNLWVHDNVILMDVGETGIVRNIADPVWSPEWNNRFDHNNYILSDARKYYNWNGDSRSTAEWQVYGQDPHGTWITASRPGAPSPRQGRPASFRVTVSWRAPASTGGAPIQDYLIKYRPRGNTTWVLFHDAVSTAPRAQVTGLTNGVLYQFRVAARNIAGIGPWSPIVEMRAGVPTRPRNMVATAGTRQVQLTWEAPAAAGGAAVTDYVIHVRLKGTATWVAFNDGVSVALYTQVTGLADGITYQFRVAAKNTRGTGAWSTVVEAEPRG